MPYQSIRVVHPDQFDSATAQTPGSKRTAAIHPGARKFTDVGEAYSSSSLEPVREYITMESNTRSSMSSATLL